MLGADDPVTLCYHLMPRGIPLGKGYGIMNHKPSFTFLEKDYGVAEVILQDLKTHGQVNPMTMTSPISVKSEMETFLNGTESLNTEQPASGDRPVGSHNGRRT